MRYIISNVLSSLALLLTLRGGVNSQYVTRNGVNFELDGQPFSFAGTNVYDAAFRDTEYAKDVIGQVVANGYRVLRTWAFNEWDSALAAHPSVYFQSWNNGVATPNTGADGLALLDAVVAEAEKQNVKLILTLTNNWADYGGMDVYVNNTKSAGAYHDVFYTDPTIATTYMNYIDTVVSRYSQSPAIFAWELANEARCAGSSSANPQSPNCSPSVITQWVDNMSAHIKQTDSNHMVSTGFEGFFNKQDGGTIYEYDGGTGQDFSALIALPNIDFGTIHTYLSNTSATYMNQAWTNQWLIDHDTAAVAAGKPVIQEEYGVPMNDPAYVQQSVYDQWHATILQSQAINGDMTWASLVVDGACPGGNPYAICPGDSSYADLVTDWIAQINGKKQ